MIAAKGTQSLTIEDRYNCTVLYCTVLYGNVLIRYNLRAGLPGWLFIDTKDTSSVRLLEVNTLNHTFTTADLEL